MDTKRREFLKQSGALGAAGLVARETPSVFASKSNVIAAAKPTLIVVYLRGGADPLATICPHADPQLAAVRPSLALPGPDASSPDRVLPLDDTFGFNPKMKELYELYKLGHCAAIVCAGSPHPTRSHFSAQDFMERAAPGMPHITKGWLNRYLEETATSNDANLRAFSLQSLLPRALRGDYPVLARPDQKADVAMAMYSQLYGGNMRSRSSNLGSKTQRAIRKFGQRTIEQLSELNQVIAQPQRTVRPFPETRFGRQFRDLAKVFNAGHGLEISAVDYGGWDTHIDEGPVDGQLGTKLADVSASIGAFAANVGPEGLKNVLILVMSEFGRTVKENGNKGSDHGHGGFMLAIGGSVNGGKVYGKWSGLEEAQLYQQRDLPVHTDFRLVFAETLLDLYGFDGMNLGMFPQYEAAEPLDFLRKA